MKVMAILRGTRVEVPVKIRMSKNVLFVCTGNTCRSPAAAALFCQHLADQGQWWVESAGIRAARGAAASAPLLRLLAERGLDLSRHCAKPLEDLPIGQFDLILVMEAEHMLAVQQRFPTLAGRVFLLAEMSGGQEAVADPYGEGLEAYEAMLAVLDRLLEAGMAEIIERAKGA